MANKIKIKKINSILYLDTRNYILFSTNYSKHEFLYYKHLENDIKALFFGENLQNVLPEILKSQRSEYIEIYLDKYIQGGISYNEGDIVESNLSKSIANQIIIKLKKKISDNLASIEFF